MAYTTVLVHLDDDSRCAERVRTAAALAGSHGSHVIGAAMTGVSRFLYQDALMEPDDPNLALHLGVLRERAGQALSAFDRQVQALELRSFERQVVDDEAGGGISQLALYADLVVISQIDPKRPSRSVMNDFPAYVVLHAGRPVWIVPAIDNSVHGSTARMARMANNILIAWNGSKEASRAISAALPLLQQAEQVRIAIIDPEQNGHALGAPPGAWASSPPGEPPGAALATYLARHGVRAERVLRQSEGHSSFLRSGHTGEALLTLAHEVQADLLVMGAYGHSRVRETIMGGTTRTILERMTLPVLMMH
jgi:nucleotide-binding universal stress UspA family protein